jgi:hypothetical protein
MKTLINKVLSFLFICLPIASIASGHNKKDTTTCLQISGKVGSVNQDVKGITVVCLVKNNRQVTCLEVKPGKIFSLNLEKDNCYAIMAWNQYYVMRSVNIDTHVPLDLKDRILFCFYVDMAMRKKSASEEENRFPSALINFDKAKGWFDYSYK